MTQIDAVFDGLIRVFLNLYAIHLLKYKIIKYKNLYSSVLSNTICDDKIIF